MMRSFASAVCIFSLAVQCGALGVQGRDVRLRLHRQLGQMNPEVVARTLTEVEEKWMQQATSFARCNQTSESCMDGTMGEFEQSCQTVARAIVAGSNGDKSDVKDYLDDVCTQNTVSEGWKHEVCTGFSAALESAMTEDAYTNREQLDLGNFCRTWLKNGFLKRAADAELAREAQAEEEARKRAEEEEKEAEAKKAEEERERAAEVKAEEARAKAEEAQRAKEEAAQKKAEAEAQAAEAERKKAEAAEAERTATKKSVEANVTVTAAQEAKVRAVAKSAVISNSTATLAANSSDSVAMPAADNSSMVPMAGNSTTPAMTNTSLANATAAKLLQLVSRPRRF